MGFSTSSPATGHASSCVSFAGSKPAIHRPADGRYKLSDDATIAYLTHTQAERGKNGQ
jgi:hypothetical protein